MMYRLLQVLRALAPDCREATRLQSDALERRLFWLRRLGLRIHLLYCVWCSRYGRQILFVRQTAQKIENEPDAVPLSNDAKARMRLVLKTGKLDKPD
jgi:hypothetical protein